MLNQIGHILTSYVSGHAYYVIWGYFPVKIKILSIRYIFNICAGKDHCISLIYKRTVYMIYNFYFLLEFSLILKKIRLTVTFFFMDSITYCDLRSVAADIMHVLERRINPPVRNDQNNFLLSFLNINVTKFSPNFLKALWTISIFHVCWRRNVQEKGLADVTKSLLLNNLKIDDFWIFFEPEKNLIS